MTGKPDLGVRVVKPFNQFSVGRVIFPDGVMRQRWLSSGFVEVVKSDDNASKRPVISVKK